MKKYEDWIEFKEILGTDRIPPRAAFVIANAIKEGIRRGDISKINQWQLLEYLAADYLAG